MGMVAQRWRCPAMTQAEPAGSVEAMRISSGGIKWNHRGQATVEVHAVNTHVYSIEVKILIWDLSPWAEGTTYKAAIRATCAARAAARLRKQQRGHTTLFGDSSGTSLSI